MKLIPTDYAPDHEPVPPLLRDDPKFACGKIAFFQYVAVGVFLFLLAGFWRLQVQNPDYYFDRAERNRIRSRPILAPRGKILDRDGRVIVDSHASLSLILSRENLAGKELHLQLIADGLGLDYGLLMERLRRFDKVRHRYDPIIIKEELRAGELAFVETHRGHDDFPEMELIPAQRRLYPRNGFAAHVVGYTGEIGEAELNSPQFSRYRQGDVIGKAGIERQYNSILMGVDGQRRVIVDHVGRVRTVIDNKEAIIGQNLTLTIDLDLQAVAELALEGRRGAVAALDPRSGEVLAMVSHPAYDPNRFREDWPLLRDNPDYPLLNRAIQTHLAPGSTFKPIVAMAALDAGAVDSSTTFTCTGGASFYGRFFKCHNSRGHGSVDLYRALRDSCDVYFYNLGYRIGIDKIAEFAELAGLGKRTGIDLPNESAGIVPSTHWNMRNNQRKWYAGETISVAIGQGALVVTPLQLAYAMGGLAMGGVWHRPHLAKDLHPPEPPRRAALNLDHLREVVDGLCAVVNDAGTAARSRLPGIEMCGKTGTAQLVSNELARSGRLAQQPKDNAWFFAFAPRENPEIVVAVLWEAGLHGSDAAPIARDVIKAYFDKKDRTQPRALLGRLQP